MPLNANNVRTAVKKEETAPLEVAKKESPLVVSNEGKTPEILASKEDAPKEKFPPLVVSNAKPGEQVTSVSPLVSNNAEFLNTDPLVTHIFTADPSAHVFNGKLYVYPSHDFDFDIPENDTGDHFAMRDYHVLSVDINEKANTVTTTDHGTALSIDDVPWAERQMRAPDAAYKDGTYFLYFPAKDKDDVFRIGVATSKSPTGPFIAQPEPIQGSYSIDPAVFQDDDGTAYIYVGGLHGGQLQRWKTGTYFKEDEGWYPIDDQPQIPPRVAKMHPSMLEMAEPLKDVVVKDPKTDKPIRAGDHERRFFEAPWVHKHNGLYYYSWSTGDTHNIQYAVSDTPYGPFVYHGKILEPVFGWTNHHSIVEYNDKSYLFYHDSSLSQGKTHLRCVKVTELIYDKDGYIQTVNAWPGRPSS